MSSDKVANFSSVPSRHLQWPYSSDFLKVSLSSLNYDSLPPQWHYLWYKCYFGWLQSIKSHRPQHTMAATDHENKMVYWNSTPLYSATLTENMFQINRNFMAIGCHSLLWTKLTIFSKPQRTNLSPEATTVTCGRRTLDSLSHKILWQTRQYDHFNSKRTLPGTNTHTVLGFLV